jgi:hypothetical protein
MEKYSLHTMNSKRNRIDIWIISTVLLALFSSCEDFVSVPPSPTELNRQDVFNDNSTAQAALVSIYSKLSTESQGFARGWLSVYEGAYADELTSLASISTASPIAPFYFNSIVPSNPQISALWGSCYNSIYSANLIIEGLRESDQVSTGLKNQFLGEALFIRAFCHFYLVNLFGDVPLVTTSDYRINAHLPRSPAIQVYERIITDLLDAKDILSDTYPSEGRVRPNKGAAIALLARAYLYAGDFKNAEAQATEIIDKTSQYKLSDDLNAVFRKNSEEAIWQLFINSQYTEEGSVFILVAAPPSNVILSNGLYNAFENNDLRKTHWINKLTSPSGNSTWYYAFKYKENVVNASGAEYPMIMRLAEQYLIRAEARTQQDILTGVNSAESDINIIRNRAGLTNTTASDKEQLLLAIEQERRVELFTEWGHRFFDLKRTRRLDDVMHVFKRNWNAFNAVLPLPQSEVLINKNLKQNTGY